MNSNLIVSAVDYGQPVGKSFAIDDEGQLVKERPMRPPVASAVHLQFDSFKAFEDWRMGQSANVMLVAGTFASAECDGVPALYKREVDKTPGAVAASKEYLAFREQPGVMILDHDVKDRAEVAGLYPEDLTHLGSGEAFAEALDKVLPEARACAMLVGGSTSSNINDAEGKVRKGPGGLRGYLPVTDASDIPRVMNVAHKRSIIQGYGWAFVDAGGGFQERSLVDLALARPTQPDYAAPDLNDGLEQDRGWASYDGDWLDPAVVPDLTPEEEALYAAKVKEMRAALADDMKRQKAVAKRRKEKKLIDSGVEPKRAKKTADLLYDHGVVTGADVVIFDDGEAVAAATLITNGADYDERICLDPIDPDYDGGRCVGIFYWNDGQHPIVHSYAHGPHVYRLRHDLDSLKAVIATGEQDAIIAAMARAELLPLESKEAENASARALGLGNSRRELRQAVEAERQAMRAHGRDEKDEEADDGSALVLDSKSPLQSARRFVELNHTQAGVHTLHHHGGDFCVWNGRCYQETGSDAIRAEIYDFLDQAKGPEAAPFNPNARKVSDVEDALRATAHLDRSVKPPAWLGDTTSPPAEELLACANGLLHLPTRQLLPPTPEFLTFNALDYAFEPDADEPVAWLNFLDDQWHDDLESIQALQEMCGYALTHDTRQQKILIIVGPKRSGKGTIESVFTGVVGADNVANPTLASLSTQFGLQPLINKQLAVISDARLGARVDQSPITERLLSISGEDGQTIDRKHKSAWYGWLPTRFIILTNELPRLADASGALPGRFIVLRMTKSFFGREDHGLKQKLLSELPGILNWALDGWQRLQEHGRFIQPKTAADDVEALEDLASPIGRFIKDRCETGPSFEVIIDDLYHEWRKWCSREGRNFPSIKETFGRDLKTALPSISITQPRDANGKRPRLYQGIGLAATGDNVLGLARAGTRAGAL